MTFAYLSSNLALMSALAFLFKAGSLNKSLLTLFLSKLISTEYLLIQNKEKIIHKSILFILKTINQIVPLAKNFG